jgi:hypothetical protein
MHLVVSFDPDDVTVGALPGCTATPGRVVCDYTGPVGSTVFSLAFVGRPQQHDATASVDFDLTLDGYEDQVPADNHDTVVLHRQ